MSPPAPNHVPVHDDLLHGRRQSGLRVDGGDGGWGSDFGGNQVIGNLLGLL